MILTHEQISTCLLIHCHRQWNQTKQIKRLLSMAVWELKLHISGTTRKSCFRRQAEGLMDRALALKRKHSFSAASRSRSIKSHHRHFFLCRGHGLVNGAYLGQGIYFTKQSVNACVCRSTCYFFRSLLQNVVWNFGHFFPYHLVTWRDTLQPQITWSIGSSHWFMSPAAPLIHWPRESLFETS